MKQSSRPTLLPDAQGFFGRFGGRYAPEVLLPNLEELTGEFTRLSADPTFWQDYVTELQSFSGRPTPVTELKRLSKGLGGARIFLKREDLGQTGAHKINNVIGQGLIARRLGKRRIIAETGAGQHGVATATMAARFGLEATIYMGAEDVERQRPNVFWMTHMGAKVVAVEDGTRTLKDAINEAMRDWSANFADTHYVLGTACGPHPFPALVAWLQSVIGQEASQQMHDAIGRNPDAVYACVGGGSNALGLFQGFLGGQAIRIVGCEAGGKGGDGQGQHARRLAGGQGSLGIAQGYKTYFLQSPEGQLWDTHSVAAGLDYVGVSPIVAHLYDTHAIDMASATDDEVKAVVRLLMEHEGIIPALESAHALAVGFREAKSMQSDQVVLIGLSGRGDKDIFTVAEALHDESWGEYLKTRAQRILTRDSRS